MIGLRARALRSASQRVREVGQGRLWLLARTFCLLVAAKIVLRWIPVQRIVQWKQRPLQVAPSTVPLAESEERYRIAWAVQVVARWSPIEFVCFPQCLAAIALLRKKGIESRLFYGVTRVEDKLVTHTWLESAGEILIGGGPLGALSSTSEDVLDEEHRKQSFSTLAVF